MLISLFLLTPLLSTSASHAERFDLQKYFTVGAPTVQMFEESDADAAVLHGIFRAADETPMPPARDPVPRPPGDHGNHNVVYFNDTIVILDQIVNIGEKLWTMVEANKPLVNVTNSVAHALPQGLNAWAHMQSWQAPKSRIFRVTYRNLMGLAVVDFTYRVLYTYGGNVHSIGKYLANVTVIPGSLAVSWGYTFNAAMRVAEVVNTESVQSPVAGMELQASWKINTLLKYIEESSSFFVSGDGKFVDLTNGN